MTNDLEAENVQLMRDNDRLGEMVEEQAGRAQHWERTAGHMTSCPAHDVGAASCDCLVFSARFSREAIQAEQE